MTEQQYERLKKFLGLFYESYMKRPDSPPSVHPLVVLAQWEKKAPAKAKEGLLMTVNDFVEDSSDWSPEQIADANRRFVENGAPLLSEIRKTYSKKYKRIVERGIIKSHEEYYLVKGVLDGGSMDVDAAEAEKLTSMLENYEVKVVSARKT